MLMRCRSSGVPKYSRTAHRGTEAGPVREAVSTDASSRSAYELYTYLCIGSSKNHEQVGGGG